MTVFQWDRYLSVGCDKMDSQHENMFAYVKRLQNGIEDKVATGDLRRLLIDLYRYARYHFAEED